MSGGEESETARPGASRLGVVAVAAATVCWSFGGVLGKSVDATGVVITTWRMTIMAALFNLLLLAATRTRLTWDVVRRAAPAGVLFAANLTVFFTAIRHTSIANAAVIGALTPVCVLPFAARYLGEKVSWLVGACALVAVGGVAVAVVAGGDSGGERSWLGDGLAVVSLVMWVGYLFVIKRTRGGMGTLQFQAGMSTVAVVVLVPACLVSGQDLGGIRGTDWVWLVLLALVPGMLGHGLITWAQPHVDVSISSVLIQGEPVGQTLTAAIFLGEAVAVGQGVALAVVIAALALLAFETSRPARAPTAADPKAPAEPVEPVLGSEPA